MLTLAILGAGASGIAAAVAAKKAGILPKIFELSHDIGGVWRPDNQTFSEKGRAWPEMRVNISRHTGTFSDFSWWEDADDFPTTQEVYKYLNCYADHFNIKQFIHFGCNVCKIFPSDVEKWIIQGEQEGNAFEETFDAVIVATGKFTNPYIPSFKGFDQITVPKLHSAYYRSVDPFINKKVLVVGGSLSGTSIAEELAKKTQVVHLLRRPRWVIKRYRSCDPKNDGPLLPRDLLKSEASDLIPLSTEKTYQSMLEHCALQNEYDQWKMLQSSPLGFVVADEYFIEVDAGNITPVQGEIDYFLKSAVKLKDGQWIDFDAVIFCTGYQQDEAFLPRSFQNQVNSYMLYEDIFPEDSNSIAFIGLYPGARGAVFPIVELQAEFACQVFTKMKSLPPQKQRKEEILNTPRNRNEIKYLNALAKKLEILPDYTCLNAGEKHILWDGAFTSARFLLAGKNKEKGWELIRKTEAIRRERMHANDNIPTLQALCMRKLKKM